MLSQFVKMLNPAGSPAMGFLLGEVGHLSDLFDEKARAIFTDLLIEAFAKAGAAEHGPPQIFWKEDSETVAAFRHEVLVKELSPLTNIRKVDPWRVLERFEIWSEVALNNPCLACSLLLYNTHQPASDLRPFAVNQRIAMCKAILFDASSHVSSSDAAATAWAFATDGNLSLCHWSAALNEERQMKIMPFRQLQMRWGPRKKPGNDPCLRNKN